MSLLRRQQKRLTRQKVSAPYALRLRTGRELRVWQSRGCTPTGRLPALTLPKPMPNHPSERLALWFAQRSIPSPPSRSRRKRLLYRSLELLRPLAPASSFLRPRA